MRLYLVEASLPAPIDLNAVRLETLLGAVRDARGRLKQMVSMAPEWFDAEERGQWGFALGEADVALERAVRAAVEETAGEPPLRAYARTLGAVARVARWCVGQSEPWARSELPAALAFEAVADELAPILHHANRAPRWLRERARRARRIRFLTR